jgi:hypothetical protein
VRPAQCSSVIVGAEFEMSAVDKMPITRMQRRNSQFQRKVSIRIGMYECNR